MQWFWIIQQLKVVNNISDYRNNNYIVIHRQHQQDRGFKTGAAASWRPRSLLQHQPNYKKRCRMIISSDSIMWYQVISSGVALTPCSHWCSVHHPTSLSFQQTLCVWGFMYRLISFYLIFCVFVCFMCICYIVIYINIYM